MENRYKFPRIAHCPWSEGVSQDDKLHPDMDYFKGRQVLGTIKMDGENTTMSRDYIHARSVDSGHHESRAWVKQYWARIKYQFPDKWRFCGENLYAEHSIAYRNLESYFYLFMIWNENNVALGWDDTATIAMSLNITQVPVFYRGLFDPAMIHLRFNDFKSESKDPVEGYVVRVLDPILYDETGKGFFKSMFKWVRKDHVQTDSHWMSKSLIPNRLAI